MKRSTLLLVALALPALGCRPEPSDTDSTDTPVRLRAGSDEKPGTIVGKWVVISSEVEGRPAPKEADHYSWMTFSGEDAMLGARTRKHDLRFTLDTTKQPNEITLWSKQEKVKWNGIYQVKGNVLRLSYGPPNGERPTNLNTSQGAKAILYVLKRDDS